MTSTLRARAEALAEKLRSNRWLVQGGYESARSPVDLIETALREVMEEMRDKCIKAIDEVGDFAPVASYERIIRNIKVG